MRERTQANLEIPGSTLRVARNDGETYFFSIGGATFSAGAGGKAALAPSC
jgi:hypothetical protein